MEIKVKVVVCPYSGRKSEWKGRSLPENIEEGSQKRAVKPRKSDCTMQASGSCSEISRKSPPQEVTQLELLLQKSSKACPKETLLVGA